MSQLAKIYLWDTLVGVVALHEHDRVARFQYNPDFLLLGVQIAPLKMPLDNRVYSFPSLNPNSFHGLPGMLADSLPDKFGSEVLRKWLASNGKSMDDLTVIDRLCYTGTRGMGALEFQPAIFSKADQAETISVDNLLVLASEVLRQRIAARAELVPGMIDFAPILKVGSSAGGARAKALIGWNEATGEVRSGQTRLPAGFGYWLLKFDGIEGNGDKEESERNSRGRIEYAYHLMAREAGVEMSECRLWDGRHFMTRRFDRSPDGGKLHMQSLAALAHFDFHNPVSYAYEDMFDVCSRIVGDMRAQEQLFIRMCFNVLACNCDDHVKNVAFLMDRTGKWSLAPAFDITYTCDDIEGHQMSVHGKNVDITDHDLLSAARIAGLKSRRTREALDRVRAAVARWPDFAERAQVPADIADEIRRRLPA